MLRSPSHAFLHRTIQATCFIFFFSCFRISLFFSYFTLRSEFNELPSIFLRAMARRAVENIRLQKRFKTNGSFRSCVNPLHLRETGPKSCTFTYLLSRRGNRVSRADRRATFRPRLFLLPKNQSRENRLARSHGL